MSGNDNGLHDALARIAEQKSAHLSLRQFVEQEFAHLREQLQKNGEALDLILATLKLYEDRPDE